MKTIAIALGILALIAGAISFNVWRADHNAITSTPDAFETGKLKLHTQLDESKRLEAQFEKQDWNSITSLHGLIQAHEQRIAKLSGNSQAAEIVAHDREAIARIQQRINDLEAQAAAAPPEQADSADPAAQSASPDTKTVPSRN